MINTFLSMLRDDEGASLVEYGLILSLVAVVAIATLTTVGQRVNGKLTAVSNALQ